MLKLLTSQKNLQRFQTAMRRLAPQPHDVWQVRLGPDRIPTMAKRVSPNPTEWIKIP